MLVPCLLFILGLALLIKGYGVNGGVKTLTDHGVVNVSRSLNFAAINHLLVYLHKCKSKSRINACWLVVLLFICLCKRGL